MPTSQTKVQTTRGIQQMLIAPARSSASLPMPVESKGVVYTKRWVVELILDVAGYRSENNLVDRVAVEPAAGEGAFLSAMIERLVDSCTKQNKSLSDCRGSLIAYELDDCSATKARAIAVETLMTRGLDRDLAQDLAGSWVLTGDYLLEATNVAADFVIGNPPYVRLEDIPEEIADIYRSNYRTMRGRADLYIAFFEAALNQLKEAGTCAFICADRWMRNQYGSALRAMVTSGYAVEAIMEMHNANAFHDEVDAYPAITVIRRRKQSSTVVASADTGIERVPPATLSRTLSPAGLGQKRVLQQGLRAALVESWFHGAEPWPCQSPEQLSLLRRLEDKFPALESTARVGIGVATGNDKIFITKDAHLVESSRLLKLGMVKDIWNGTMAWSGHYLIDPWDNKGLVNLEAYPLLRAYFEKNCVALKRRHTAINCVRGWYKTIDRITHELTHKAKLYIADIKSALDPVLDRGETYPHHNLYFIESDQWDLEVLGSLLMSTFGQFFVESYGVRMRGGYLRFQAQYLRRIRVPHPKALSSTQARALKDAFHARDKQLATQIALDVYGIDKNEMETALGS